MDEGLELLGRSAGGSGATSRASSEHGGAGSERRREATERALAGNQQRLGTEYVSASVSGIAKHVDRLIEVCICFIVGCIYTSLHRVVRCVGTSL